MCTVDSYILYCGAMWTFAQGQGYSQRLEKEVQTGLMRGQKSNPRPGSRPLPGDYMLNTLPRETEGQHSICQDRWPN